MILLPLFNSATHRYQVGQLKSAGHRRHAFVFGAVDGLFSNAVHDAQSFCRFVWFGFVADQLN